ncbi:MAG: peptidoglycan DD-metalloendopeptidase family protein [bacterium]
MNLSNRLVILLILTAGVYVSLSTGNTADVGGQAANQLKQKIKDRQTEIDRLRNRREDLDKTAREQSRELKKYEVQFHHYLANLENSEKRAQTMEQELVDLLEHSNQREMFLEIVFPIVVKASGPGDEDLRQAAVSVVADLYRRETEEGPLRNHLTEKIEEEQSYQQRIRERYMVNDEERREQTLKELENTQNKAKSNLETEQQIADELKDMKNRLASLDKQLAKLQEQSVKSAGSTKTAQAPFQPGQPFLRLKGQLPWPAQGRVVREYGPFTHPTLGVKLESKGIDVSVNPGTRVKAVADGRILYVGELESYGAIVALDHGDGYLTVYGNVEAGGVKTGQVVSAGNSIGVVGKANGNNSPLYHFEIRSGDQAMNPTTWLAR